MQEVNEETGKNLLTLFYINYQTSSKSQLSNLCDIAKDYCAWVKKKQEKEDKDFFKDEILEISVLYSNPLQFFIEKRKNFLQPSQIKRLSQINFSVPKLDWVYWRDSHFPYKINYQYPIVGMRASKQKYIELGEIIEVVGFVKSRLNSIVVKASNFSESGLNFTFPQIQEERPQQLGVAQK